MTEVATIHRQIKPGIGARKHVVRWRSDTDHWIRPTRKLDRAPHDVRIATECRSPKVTRQDDQATCRWLFVPNELLRRERAAEDHWGVEQFEKFFGHTANAYLDRVGRVVKDCVIGHDRPCRTDDRPVRVGQGVHFYWCNEPT